MTARTVALERDRQLSESMLWGLQRGYYTRQSMQAWGRDAAARRLTCSPAMALAYARVVMGYLRDWQSVLDPGQPVYIVELGAGSGRFGYQFLVKFSELLERSHLRGLRYTYVLTDPAEAALDFWQAHAKLQPFVAAGQLDFARFDPEHPAEALTLRRAGVTLAAGAVLNPPVLLANDVFSRMPQDAFAVQGGRLHECLVSVCAPRPAHELDWPELLASLKIDFERRPAAPGYYADLEWDAILAAYERRLGDTHFVFPSPALRCLREFRRLGAERLLLLSSDRGYSREEELIERREPAPAAQDTLALEVNYHAIGEACTSQGGLFLNTGFRAADLEVCACLWGRPPGEYKEVRGAYRAAVERHHPADLARVRQALETRYAGLDLEQLLAWLRLTGWDPDVFCNVFSALMEPLPTAPDHLHAELYRAIHGIWRHYYYAGEPEDVPFFLAMLLCQMRYFSDALEYLQYSRALHGPDPATSYNMALCYYELREFDKARQCLDDTLALDPHFESAEEMRRAVKF